MKYYVISPAYLVFVAQSTSGLVTQQLYSRKVVVLGPESQFQNIQPIYVSRYIFIYLSIWIHAASHYSNTFTVVYFSQSVGSWHPCSIWYIYILCIQLIQWWSPQQAALKYTLKIIRKGIKNISILRPFPKTWSRPPLGRLLQPFTSKVGDRFAVLSQPLGF